MYWILAVPYTLMALNRIFFAFTLLFDIRQRSLSEVSTLTLECRVIYKQDQPLRAIDEDIKERYYTQGDPHTAYYGQILNAYIAEE